MADLIRIRHVSRRASSVALSGQTRVLSGFLRLTAIIDRATISTRTIPIVSAHTGENVV